MIAPDLREYVQLIRAGKADAVREKLEKVVSADPTHVAVHAVLAMANDAEGRFDEAVTAWRRAHTLVPDSPAVAEGLRRALRRRLLAAVDDRLAATAQILVGGGAPDRSSGATETPTAAPPAGGSPVASVVEDAPIVEAPAGPDGTPRMEGDDAPFASADARPDDTPLIETDDTPVATAAATPALAIVDTPVAGNAAMTDDAPVDEIRVDEIRVDEPPASEPPVDRTASDEIQVETGIDRPAFVSLAEAAEPPAPSTGDPVAFDETDAPLGSDVPVEDPGGMTDVSANVDLMADELAGEFAPRQAQVEGLDDLIRELETARIVPDPNVKPVEPSEIEPDVEDVVSETLARIYSNQRFYDEAARVYDKLAEQQPARAAEFRLKAEEIRSRGRR